MEVFLINKKVISLCLIATLSIPMIGTNTVFAKSNEVVNVTQAYSQNSNDKDFTKMINEVQNYIVWNEDGTLSLTEKLPQSLDKYNIPALKAHLDNLNEQAKLGNIIIHKDLSIDDSTNSSFTKETRAGKSSVATHWWGYEYYWNTSDCTTMISACNKIIAGSAASAVLGGFFAPLIGIVGGLNAAYWNMFKSDIQLYNKGKGIVAHIGWVGNYKMWGQ